MQSSTRYPDKSLLDARSSTRVPGAVILQRQFLSNRERLSELGDAYCSRAIKIGTHVPPTQQAHYRLRNHEILVVPLS